MKSYLSQFCDRALEAGWLLGVIITPVFFNVYSSRVFEPDKLTTLRALAVVMAVLWLTRWVEGLLRKEPVLRFSWRTPMVLPAAVTMGVYLVSTAFSLVPFTSFIGSYQRLQGTFTLFGYLVVFLAILTSLRTRAQLSRLMTVLILNSLPISLYGIIQHSGQDPLPWAGDVMSRVASNMGNAIFVAAYLIMIVPLTGARIVESFNDILSRAQTRFSDILRASGYIFLIAVQLITIWFSGSRGPWLGTVAAAFLFPYLGLILLQQRALAQADEDAPGNLGTDILKGAAFGIGVTGVAGLLAALAVTILKGTLAMYIGGGLALLVFGGAWLYFVVERKGWRWLWLAWGVVGLAVAVGLVLINVPGPLQDRVRQVQVLYRLTTITELEGGTGKVRGLIWQGTVELIQPHDPIKFPDGTVDRWNFLRPLLGYGPESMYVAYNSFYPPELGHYESRTASPDRSHNETLDSLTITGGLGFAAYLFTFVSVFYWGFRWLGLLKSARQMWLYLGLIVLFFAIFFVIAWRLEGAYLFAVAVPLGVLVGTMAYLTLAAFGAAIRQSGASFNEQETPSPHALLLVGILTAVIAHFVEINFGIAIASTRTMFWALAGLLVVLGSRWVPGILPEEAPVEESPDNDRRPTLTRRLPKRGAGGAAAWLPAVLALSLAAVFLLGTLAFDFINNPEQLADSGKIFVNSLTMKYYPEPTPAYGALMIFMFTWLLFGVVGLSEYDREDLFGVDRARTLLIASGVYIGVALFGLLLFGSVVAGHQAHLRTLGAASIEEVVDIAEKLASLVAQYYGLIFTLVVMIGLVLLWEDRAPALSFGHPASWGILIVLLAVSAFFIIPEGCYDLVRADIIYKQGGVFANQNDTQQKEIGIAHFKRALKFTPREDYYDLFLGKAYLELTQGMPVSFAALPAETQETLLTQLKGQVNWDTLSPEQQELQVQQWRTAWEQQQKQRQQELFLETEKVLKHARALNPLNTDHSANLARFYKSWAGRVAADMNAAGLTETEKAQMSAQHQELLQKSLKEYETALILSPNNPIIWNEKAQLFALDMGDMVRFNETITQSLKVDEGFEQTWMLLGDMRSSTGDVDGAIAAYQRSLEIRNNCTVRRVIGTLQAQKPDWAASVATLSDSLEVCKTSSDLWDFYRIIAIGQANLGNTDAALTAAQQSLALAPESQRAYVEQLIASLQPQVITTTTPVTP